MKPINHQNTLINTSYSITTIHYFKQKTFCFQCLQNEFTCESSECISLERRCDGIADCEGNYDEKNCTLIKADEDLYQQDKSPFGKNGKVTEVVVHVTILDFGALDEIEQWFQLRFFLQLQWYEHQLNFLFVV